ncbi:hypothetical protein C8F04DRAFT_1210128 [Mycena alexandri]|uniref:Integrase core domain-containing protein n=1 Tax=Mycena alexandri TaxID=1745969 RepID=A0AAD6X5F1_9AGAR|nr:hypothetical protein C8F04DRAFT_1210128 [Mycena alexandri]
MENERRVARGSYIWGRSWKLFFIDLEVNHGLNPSIPVHIWLLHHLFLRCINKDAQEWPEAWNAHDLHIRGERTQSPHDIFLFSMIQDGPRGLKRILEPADESLEDPTTYSIDWDVMDDPALMRHHLMQNPDEWWDHNPFAPGVEDLSDVPCEPLNCPFSPVQVAHLDQQLSAMVDTSSRSMQVRKLVWQEAFCICNVFYE